MLRPQLSPDIGRREIGTEVGHWVWNLNKDEPFVQCFHRISDLQEDFVRRHVGIISIGRWGGSMTPLPGREREAETIHDKWRKFAGELNDRFCQSLSGCFILFDSPFIQDSMYAVYHNAWVLDQLYNAVEHGSDWCEAGDVHVELARGDEGILTVISQPKDGPDYREIAEQVAKGTFRREYIEKYPGWERGAGMLAAVGETHPWIWGEKIKGSGYVTTILETRARLRAVAKVKDAGKHE